jgi:hypothetical protein
MRHFILTVWAIMFSTTALAQAGGGIQYAHNGSSVVLKEEGAVITITYDYPSKMMTSLGAVIGSPVFEGAINRRTDDISGSAYKYAGHCGRVPFLVFGRFYNPSMSALRLRGSIPLINMRTCRVTGYTAVTLEFYQQLE